MPRVAASRAEIAAPIFKPRASLRWFPALLLGFLLFAGAPLTATSAPGVLGGTWHGNGWVSFSSGSREPARCRVQISEQSARTFAVRAVCATESGRVSQQAVVRKAGGNSYVGSFYNAEYDVSGSIHLSVRGATATARLTSHSGSAVISLSR